MTPDADTPPQGTVRDWLDHRAQMSGTRDAYIFFDGAAPMTWAGLRDEARDLATRLTAQGVPKGASVAIAAERA